MTARAYFGLAVLYILCVVFAIQNTAPMKPGIGLQLDEQLHTVPGEGVVNALRLVIH